MNTSRQTEQKKIIEALINHETGFFSAEQIFSLAKKKDTKIGIATIYRFLKERRKKNKLYSYMCDRKMLYSTEKKSHCHYLCEKTGKITHFDIDNLDFLKSIKQKIPGSITSFQIEIKGVCKECEE